MIVKKHSSGQTEIAVFTENDLVYISITNKIGDDWSTISSVLDADDIISLFIALVAAEIIYK